METPLAEFVNKYTLQRDICRQSVHNLHAAVRNLERFMARPAVLSDLNRDTVNRFLAAFSSDHRPSTVRGTREKLLTLWRAAHEDGALTEYPSRIRPVKVPASNPDSWSRDEVLELLGTANELDGTFYRNRVPVSRAGYFVSYISIVFETGMRLRDVLALRWDHFGAGKVCWTQSKTGKPMSRPISPELMALLRRTFSPERELLFGGVIQYARIRRYFVELVAAAGLGRGTLRKLRRTSGNEVELANPGWGHLHLGNTRQIFEAHYADRLRIAAATPAPVPLVGSLEGGSMDDR